HFMAISWMYREDYREAGFRMLAHEKNGRGRVSRKSLFYTIFLVALTYVTAFNGGQASLWYICLNTLLSIYILFHAARFLSDNNKEANAKSLFYATIMYLPIFMILFALDRYI
ncbi:MAG: UbiA family prenyltransferase, partial [Opitutae bacterium]|nr:UbiA family prenyltransferase [Opitutae bacterium]